MLEENDTLERPDLVKSLRATEIRSTALLSKLLSRASLARDNKLSPRPNEKVTRKIIIMEQISPCTFQSWHIIAISIQEGSVVANSFFMEAQYVLDTSHSE